MTTGTLTEQWFAAYRANGGRATGQISKANTGSTRRYFCNACHHTLATESAKWAPTRQSSEAVRNHDCSETMAAVITRRDARIAALTAEERGLVELVRSSGALYMVVSKWTGFRSLEAEADKVVLKMLKGLPKDRQVEIRFAVNALMRA